jgi:anti-sigma-K factor RskA/prefoldin subunit 5
MSDIHTPRIEELLPAYALDALEGEELRELEAHLAGGCEECGRQLALWQGDLEELAAAVPPVEPSEITRARVLRLAGAGPAALPPRGVMPPRRAPWWLAAAALVLLVFTVWGLVRQSHLRKEMGSEAQGLAAERDRLRGQIEGLSREVDRLRTEVTAARTEAREARSVLEDRDRLRQQVEVLNREMSRLQIGVVQAKQDLQVLAAPGVQAVALTGLGSTRAANGSAYVNPSSRNALFYAFNLPPLPADKTYQLWFIVGGKPVSAGTFAVDPRGTASLRVERVAEARQIKGWAVTIEPRGGVPQPTGTFVLKGA